jgi:transposase
VVLDETGLTTAMTRRYGRAPRGQRLVEAVPEAHWQTTTLVTAVRRGGVVGALEFPGATDEMAFRTYLDEVLVPALRPGDIVVLDNLAAHRVKAMARHIRMAGAGCWYLPPYSPDFSPIEKVWAKVKALVRKAKARTPEAVGEAITQALGAVTPEDCQGCFDFCGYRATPECETL